MGLKSSSYGFLRAAVEILLESKPPCGSQIGGLAVDSPFPHPRRKKPTKAVFGHHCLGYRGRHLAVLAVVLLHHGHSRQPMRGAFGRLYRSYLG